MNLEQSVPKRRHVEFRRRGITQKRIQECRRVWASLLICYRILSSVVFCIATRLQDGRSRVRILARTCSPAVGSTQPPVNGCLGSISAVKRSGCGIYHTSPSSAEVKCGYTLPLYTFMAYRAIALLLLFSFLNHPVGGRVRFFSVLPIGVIYFEHVQHALEWPFLPVNCCMSSRL